MVAEKKKKVFRQEQIAAAAAKLIVKLGGEHVTIKNLALEIGLSEASIYRHFSNKSAIFHFLIGYAERILLSDFTYVRNDEFVESTGLDYLMKRLISNVIERRGIYFQVFSEVVSMGDRQLNKKALNAIHNYIAYVSQIFRINPSSEYFRKDSDPDCSAFIFYSLLQSLVNFWTLSNYSFDLKDKFDNVWYNYRISQ